MAHRLGLLQLVQLLEPAIGPSLQPWSVATSLMLSQEMSGDNGWGEVWGSRGCGGKALGTKWVNTYSVYLLYSFCLMKGILLTLLTFTNSTVKQCFGRARFIVVSRYRDRHTCDSDRAFW